jgi:hypothetical protein
VAGGISRRAFVGRSASLVAISAVPVGLLTRGSPRRAGMWTRSRFMPFVGATFRMTGGGEKADVVLAEISDLSPVLRPADEKRFSLLFTGARDHPPADGIRNFSNDEFGEIDMFVSPIGRRTGSLSYQVIVNRL